MRNIYPSEDMGDDFGCIDREVNSNTDAVSGPEQQADGSDTRSANEQGNPERASSASAGPSVVDGTRNGHPSGEEEGDKLQDYATLESTPEFPQEGDSNIETALSSNHRCRSPDNEFSSYPPRTPCFESSIGSGSGVGNGEVSIPSSVSAVQAILSVAEVLLNDNLPPLPAIINDPGIHRDGFNRHLVNAAQGMPPPLRENGPEVQYIVQQEDPEPEFFSYSEDECYYLDFHEFEDDSSSEDEPNLFPENEFVHLPFGWNFQI